MKKEIFIICIVGMFLTSSLLSASALNPVKMNEEISNDSDDMQMSIFESNVADFGLVASVNREKSFGGVVINDKPDLEVSWVAEEGESSGYLKMDYASFIENEPGESIDNYQLSTFRITVHDGPSTSDPVLFTDEKEVLENAKDWVGELIFPVTIKTKGQSSRELTVERTAQTQLVSKIIRTPIQGKEGIETKSTAFHVNFVGPSSLEKNIGSTPVMEGCYPSSVIKLYLGTIEVWKEMDGDLITITNIVNEIDGVLVNRSEEVYIIGIVNYSINLARVPKYFGGLLGCKATFSINGGIPSGISNVERGYNATTEPLTTSNLGDDLQKSGILSCGFTVDTGENDRVIFVPSCSFSYYPISFWNIYPPGDSFKGEGTRVLFEYV